MTHNEKQMCGALQESTASTTLTSQALLERYGEHLDGAGLSEDQQKELLSTLWQIMVAFVDLGFSVKAGDKLSAGCDIGFDDVLHSICLEDTAPETAASSKITDKKEKP